MILKKKMKLMTVMMTTTTTTTLLTILVVIVVVCIPNSSSSQCDAFLSSRSFSTITFVDRSNIKEKGRKCGSFTTTSTTSTSSSLSYLSSTTSSLHNIVIEEESNSATSNSSSSSRNIVATTTEPEELLLLIDKLRDYVRRNDTSPITITNAYVLSKRSLGKNLINFDIAEARHTTNTTTTPSDMCCQAMLRREKFQGPNYDGYKRCLLKGAKFNITGIASSTRIPGNVVLLVHSMELVSVPRQQQHIQIILKQAFQEHNLPEEEASDACSDPSLPDKINNNLNNNNNFKTEREEKQFWKQLSKDILTKLPDDPNYPKEVELSNLGKFVRPTAPMEWQHIPKQIINIMIDDDDDDEGNGCITTTTTLTYDEIPSINDIVQLQKEDEEDYTTTNRISIQGWVQNRRRFDNNITMISLIDELSFGSSTSSNNNHGETSQQGAVHSQNNNDNDNDNDDIASSNTNSRLVAIIHPDLLEQCAGLYSNIVAVETKVWVSGILIVSGGDGSGDDDDNRNRMQTIWVQQIRLVQSSSRSATIRHILDLLNSKQLDLEEVADALKLPYADAVTIQQDQSLDSATQRQWKANELARKLQQSKRNVIKPELLQIMDKYNYLSKDFPVVMDDNEEDNEELKSSQAAITARPQTLMKKPAIGMAGTRWQSKKRPQLEWMGRQIRSVLQSHPEYGKRTLSILDIGGGKGSLANYLGSCIDNVQIHVVDISEGAVMNGAKKAKRLKLDDVVQFQTADASNPQLILSDDEEKNKKPKDDDDGSKEANPVDVDIVVALHACGHLSDVALGHAVHHRAGFVIVPCCFNSNPSLSMPYFGINHNNLDGLTSYNDDNDVNESVASWLGIPPDDWSSLKLLAEVQGDIDLASKGMALVCGLRAKAVTRQRSSDNEDDGTSNFGIEIRQFPLQYSTRNTVLIGKWSS